MRLAQYTMPFIRPLIPHWYLSAPDLKSVFDLCQRLCLCIGTYLPQHPLGLWSNSNTPVHFSHYLSIHTIAEKVENND